MEKEPTEKMIETAILDLCKNYYKDQIFIMKMNNVGVFDQQLGCYRAPTNKHIYRGVPDILGLLHGGRFIAVEVKRKAPYTKIMKYKNKIVSGDVDCAKFSKSAIAQIFMIERFKYLGGVAFFSYSVDNFVEELCKYGITFPKRL